MPYIAFIDLVGTRASAMISNEEYTDAINDFNNSLRQLSTISQCKIYGYSDNAYVEIQSLPDMINFFRILRDTLMNKHRYFTAAVDQGSLKAAKVNLDKNKGFSMKFTAPTTVDIYMKQCQFSGIGISLSEEVVNALKAVGMQDAFCRSIYQQRSISDKDADFVPIYDLSYNPVILEKLEYIISDYLITASTNERAGRYYITPTISMIKCLDKDIILNNLDELISLLSFQVIPEAFKNLPRNKEYSLFFMFALIEFVLSLREQDKLIDATKICELIINGYNIDYIELIKILGSISTAIISNTNKYQFLNILYNMK